MLTKTIYKTIALICLLTLSAVSAYAYDVRGKVVDNTGEPMIQASIRLLQPKDSAQVKGTVTDENGRFVIPSVKKGRYILEASYVGYTTYAENITIADKDLRLRPITLEESSIMLKETTVVGIKTPIKVMQDTVEFNADSYKTAPNAVVEDLLKRLPGVEVDSDGKITANGKEVSKILVDGREFFADDPKMATKNLPVDMIDKLQVVDRKSDLARMTGVDDGEDETVINLTVKKGMNNGWFGNAEVGYGTDNRSKASVVVNRFWDGNQLTFLGGGNNINELGFTDRGAGRFMRMGGQRGVNTSRWAGFNFNVGNEEIFRVGGNVMYAHTDRESYEKSDRQYLFADSTSFYNSERYARDKGHRFDVDLRLQWNPDSMNTFEFHPTLNLNYNRSNANDSSLTRAGNPSLDEVVRSINDNNSRGTSAEFGGRIIYNHKFRSRPGRSLSFFANYRFSNVREKSNAYSWNQFYLFNDSIDLTDRFTDNRTWSNTVTARATWTEPIGNPAKGNFVTLAYRMQYRWNNADRWTYDHPVDFPGGWDAPAVISPELERNDSLSNSYRNQYSNQDIRLGFKHVSAAMNFEAGLSLVPQMQKSVNITNDNKSIPERWVWNYAPFVRMRYRKSKTISTGIDYRGRSSQPSMSQLQPVADYSNPLNVVQGNPNLKPSFVHFLSVRYQNFNPEAQRSIMLMSFINMTQNSVIEHTSYNSMTGGKYTTYENINGVWSARVMNMVSFPLRNRTFTINNHIGLFFNQNVGYNNDLRNTSRQFNFNESFGFAWRPDNVELELRPRYGLQVVKNTLKMSTDRVVHNYGGSFMATYRTPFGIVLNSDLRYSATSGYSDGYDTRQWLWDASIAYEFLKNRQASIILRAYDLLQQNKNIRRSVTANYVDDTLFNSLTRYFMVSFSYKFNSFGEGQQPELRDRRGFGPPGGRHHF